MTTPTEQAEAKPSAADSIDGRATRSTWVAVAALVAIGLATYANGLTGPFVFDDIEAIEQNESVHSLWPIERALSLSLIDGKETVARRPLLSLSFALNYCLVGQESWGFHAVNLAIHIFAALLLLGIVRRTLLLDEFRKRYGDHSDLLAFSAALLWLVHPLQTESVTYIAQRAESLMGMLFLLTLYCSLRGFFSGRAGLWYTGAVVACAAGMGVKEVMLMAPLIVVLYDRTFVAKSFAAAWEKRRNFYSSLAATWLVLALILATGWQGASEDFVDRDPFSYAAVQPGVVLHYLRLTVWPDPLVINYPTELDFSLGYTIAAWGVVGGLLAATVWGLMRGAWFGFLGAWFFLILAPSSSFAALMQKVAEHRVYLSLAAVAVLFVLAADFLARRFLAGQSSSIAKVATIALAGAVAAAFAWKTHDRNNDYQSNRTLWQSAIANQPENASAYINLAVSLIRRGRFDEAIVNLQQAMAIDRRSDEINFNLGLALQGLKRLPEAEAEFRQAIAKNPRNWKAHFHLGVLLAQERPSDASQHFQQALVGNPRHAPAHLELGLILQDQGNFPAAIDAFRKSLDLDSRSSNAHYSLANILAMQGQLPEAIVHFNEALSLNPRDADAHTNLGTALLQQRRHDQALDHYRQALQIDANHFQANFMTAMVYLERGDAKKAADHAQRAVNIDPESEQAQDLLRRAKGG